ncbi:serine hydroxymethyltransferase [Helicobacter pylori]|uniref:serine hydroxymethyltransferase n=1 Tax=Helicobacter pylori TaxID=210 RepID=UPI000622CB57|nr:serine hydroxymethyltransferase [Helicobacter pylori]AKE81812.1 serine hydroxymethyltransferase [Helicobacter pylori J99]AVL48805.1 serine hydroxymethyltransferase [Helicobacter pylori]MWR19816.1 aminotransferase class I/II-fold pyridoxal phosphate-dependent enzyme [Helicobacter pylori]MWR35645.1 aminotransferase class I/II-fold pyridoxal phosphate-dependent enzyme [Helicobacter pylori]NPT20963.1 serine hydroxymethyltransferase [Helicobacter pylori]
MAYFLEQTDSEIFEFIVEEFKRQNEHLEMIASENYTFPSVMEAMGSILTNKYAEGYPNKRYYGGCEVVDKIESLAIERAKKLFNCQFANVQAHSGSQANNAVYHALLKPYDKILGMDLSCGGHLTHGAKVSLTGKHYQSFSYGVGLDGYIDYEEALKIAQSVKPQIIVCGFSAYPREIDFKKFREIADAVGALLLGDIAHVAGLVVANEHAHPFPHCHVVSSTTHKTLRGPRGGLILTNDEEIAAKIDKAIFPGTQGGPLMHVIAAKAVGFKENLKPEFKAYAKLVKSNMQVLAKTLKEKNHKLVSGGTSNHLLLMDFLDKPYSGKDADIALGNAGITVNKNTIPGETRNPFVTSGIRIGSAALSARGMGAKEFEIIGNKISDILNDINNVSLQLHVKEELKTMANQFPVYHQPIF